MGPPLSTVLTCKDHVTLLFSLLYRLWRDNVNSQQTCKAVRINQDNEEHLCGCAGPISVFFLFFNLVCFVTDSLIYKRLSVMCLNYGEEKYSF